MVKLASEAGVKLTPAGATFPYGRDPNDSNIRIAPTVPSVEQVNHAGEALAQISSSMQQMVELNASIASATTQQSTVVEDVNRNVTEAANLAREATDGARETAQASQHLSTIGRQIDQLVGRFRV